MSRKRITSFGILLSVFILAASGTAFAAGTGEVSMEVTCIYGDIAKEGSYVPILINISGDSFAGYAAVDAYENGDDGTMKIYRYEYPVVTGESGGSRLEVFVPLGRSLNELTGRLFDESGNELESEQLVFDVPRDRGRLVIGALSDDPGRLMYLDGADLNYGMVRSSLVALDEDVFPDDERGLEILDVIIVNDFSFSDLSDDQERALFEWVYDGGTLLFGTGENARETLGDAADIILSAPVSDLGYITVNMGAEYARDNPSDSDIELYCIEVTLSGERTVLESDGFQLLKVSDFGSGETGVFSFDLADISGFASDNAGFPARFLMEIFGEDRLSQIYFYSSSEPNTGYWDAQILVGTGDASKLPNVAVYTAAVVCYLIMIVAVYFILRRYDLARHYGIFIVALSGIFAAVIWLAGSPTRYTSEFYDCAGVIKISEGGAQETVFINARTPNGREYSFSVDPEYTVTPLLREGPRFGPEEALREDTAADPAVTITFGDEVFVITEEDPQAFESSFYKLTRSITDEQTQGIISDLSYFDGKISGTVTNGFPFDLENAAIVAYGQVIPLAGTFASGETVDLNEKVMLTWPAGMGRLLARELTGADRIGQDSEDYAAGVALTSLYAYYIDEEFTDFSPGFTLIALGPGSTLFDGLASGNAKVDGRMLYAADLDVARETDGSFYICGQASKPEVLLGAGLVNDESMTLYGSDPLTVRYYPGNDIIIEKLSFLSVSDIFMDDPDYGYLKVFDGETYLYNNITGEFDPVDILNNDLSADELKAYLLEDNSIVVRYTPNAQETYDETLVLPLLMVTGRDSDA